MFITKLLAAILFASLAVLAACGDDDDAPTATPTADANAESALAESLLLDVNDFPTGWAEGPADDEEPSPFDRCDDKAPSKGRTGEAETGEFSEGDSKEVQHSVAVFTSAADAAASLDEVRALGECLADVVNKGELDDEEAEFTDGVFGDLSFPTFGDKTNAYRLEVHIDAKNEEGPGSEGTLYLDIAFVTEGRLAFFVQVSDVFSPFDSAMFEDLVEKAHAKLEAANAG